MGITITSFFQFFTNMLDIGLIRINFVTGTDTVAYRYFAHKL